jgi:ribosomal protein L37E
MIHSTVIEITWVWAMTMTSDYAYMCERCGRSSLIVFGTKLCSACFWELKKNEV